MPSAMRVMGGVAMVLAVVSGGCSSTPPRSGVAPVEPPVEARLLLPFEGQIVFDVNQPAYVAVFDIRPYMGIEMIYPGPNDPGRAYGGIQSEPVFYLTQADEERQALTTPEVGGGQEYLYLIASRTPLDLGPFATHPIEVSKAANVLWKSIGPDAQMDSLMRNVIKPLYDVDWDSDVLILTPGGGPTGTRQFVACGADAQAFDSMHLCQHTDHFVPTLRTETPPASRTAQGLGLHYGPNGVARSGAAGANRGTSSADARHNMTTRTQTGAWSANSANGQAGTGTGGVGTGAVAHMSGPATVSTAAPAAGAGKP